MNLAALVAAALAATGSPSAPSPGATMRCADHSDASFPRAFSSPRNLVAGPLVMVGAGGFTSEDTVRRFGGNKFPLLVRNRRRVTVEVLSEAAALYYGQGEDGRVTLVDGDRVMRFVACRRDSGSRGGRHPVTFWSGFVLTAEPQCVRLRVWTGRGRSPRRAGIPLGREC